MNRLQKSSEPSLLRRDIWFPSLMIVLVGVATVSYWPDRKGFFQVDDFQWLDIANWRSVARSFIGNQGAHIAYRPIFRLSTYIDATLFGNDAMPWHIESVAWHVANAIMLAILLRSWRLPRDISSAAALLFVLAPLSGESVNWISGRTSSLCLFFSLLAAWHWTISLKYHRLPWLAAAYMILACMSYEAAAILPIELACLIPLAVKTFGVQWRRATQNTLMMLCVLIVFLLLRGLFLGTVAGETEPMNNHFLGNIREHMTVLYRISSHQAGWIALVALAFAFVISNVSGRLFPAGFCLAGIAVISLIPYAGISGSGARFFYMLQAPMCVLVVLPFVLLPEMARRLALSLLLAVTLPRFALATWHDAVSFTAAGIETRKLIEATQRVIHTGDKQMNVVDNVPETFDGQIMMGDYYEMGVAYFYRPQPAPVIFRTRTIVFYPQASASALSGMTRFWHYNSDQTSFEPMSRQAWLSLHPEAVSQQRVWDCQMSGRVNPSYAECR